MNKHPEKVTLTRRRWDAYMAPLFMGVVVIGIARIWQTGHLEFRLLLPAIALIPLWLALRLRTPRDGMLVSTIRGTPGAVVLLWFLAAALVSLVLLFALDTCVFGHPWGAPLKPYHAALVGPPVVLIFTGACWADRMARAAKAADRCRATEGEHA